METWDAIRARRNVRAFEDRPIESAVLDRVLEQSMSTFDVVIIDTPALSTGADAALLARLAGASLTLARINATPPMSIMARAASATGRSMWLSART